MRERDPPQEEKYILSESGEVLKPMSLDTQLPSTNQMFHDNPVGHDSERRSDCW